MTHAMTQTPELTTAEEMEHLASRARDCLNVGYDKMIEFGRLAGQVHARYIGGEKLGRASWKGFCSFYFERTSDFVKRWENVAASEEPEQAAAKYRANTEARRAKSLKNKKETPRPAARSEPDPVATPQFSPAPKPLDFQRSEPDNVVVPLFKPTPAQPKTAPPDERAYLLEYIHTAPEAELHHLFEYVRSLRIL